MNVSREIEYNGTKLKIYGKYYKAVLSEEGTISQNADFEISAVHDLKENKEVTELYYDFFQDLQRKIVAILIEDDKYNTSDSELDDEIDYDDILETFNEQIKSEFVMQIPVHWEGYTDDEYDRTEIKKLATRLAIEMAGSGDAILACKISHKTIRFIRMSDLKDIE